MTELVSNIKKLFLIYFTPYPYFLWCAYDRISNFGSTGIALGLMYTQVNFWICNGLIFFIWITQKKPFYIIFVFFCFFILFMYILCVFLKLFI